jgi:hypothetical protein
MERAQRCPAIYDDPALWLTYQHEAITAFAF